MNPLDKIDPSWSELLPLLRQSPLKELNELLPTISHQPATENIFRVFGRSVNKIQVVIIGQDPYYTPGTAIGYCFATSEDHRVPKSLQVIKKEIENELGVSEERELASWKTLKAWRQDCVFLLNTALTVETGKAGSHLSYWEDFTSQVISFISNKNPCIWLLWGEKAKNFALKSITKNPFPVVGYTSNTIDRIPANPDWNYILTAPHPATELYSGGNGGFYGCNHFLYTNEILKKLDKQQITW